MYLLWDQSLHTYGGMSYVSNEAYTCMYVNSLLVGFIFRKKHSICELCELFFFAESAPVNTVEPIELEATALVVHKI